MFIIFGKQLTLNFNRYDFFSKPVLFGCFDCSFIRSYCEFVLGLSGEFEVSNSFLSANSHCNIIERISQSIECHRIKQFLIAKSVPFAMLH
jgi:hypothetical protein